MHPKPKVRYVAPARTTRWQPTIRSRRLRYGLSSVTLPLMPPSSPGPSPTLTRVEPGWVGFAGTPTEGPRRGAAANRLIAPAGGVVILLVVALQLTGVLMRPAIRLDPNGPAPPSVAFATIEGDAVTIDAGTAGPVVLYFMASWCGACGPEAVAWSEASRGSTNTTVYLVDIDPFDSPESLRRFADGYGLEGVRLVLDEDGRIARALEARSLDSTVVIRDGRIVYRDAFPTPRDVVNELMRSL